ncbi:MAG TPA: lysophospholipid acyltransferase family protein [Polyangiaceae bacterium]|jgi:1-acyl-sn-glycerol-3-phosphate acyltransferase|nr:lysophospholipid acyltransferase family protein [Polyangiaceae bacterium]
MRASPSLAVSLRNVAETIAISAPTVIDAGLRRVTKERCDARLDAWSRAVLGHARIRLEVSGTEHLAPGATYVVMSNHQSFYDVPVLFRVFGPNIRMIAKSELFRIPIFGGAMRAAGFIALDREGGRDAVRSLGVARELLDRKTHVWIAPEGTRSADGTLLPFKPGAFLLAAEAGLPIAPVTLLGTREVLAPGAIRSNASAAVRVVVHPPFDAPARRAGKAARRELMLRVRRAVESAMPAAGGAMPTIDPSIDAAGAISGGAGQSLSVEAG